MRPNLAELQEDAANVRKAYSKLEHESQMARELGYMMPEAFWAAFGKARASVDRAERAVSLAREQLDRMAKNGSK